ncbi:hypothetical protein M5362_19575 [Streptomyces sp. Je 1-79]|uniref:hypothetical protein n=1 Tax=Streptomyces sp. Je 1-79 TaxID=2943847 RepID=UPI0021A53C67|nr:hypothetical protein [Streptomyces sp. Je 1-79]MCT4355338.1 hypothetical protein [Streptomyces sp. Je 1-79]
MGSDIPRTVRDPRATPLCAACGQPLGIVAKRHKVLGAWVPEWEVQPCRNARCALYVRPERADGEDDEPGTAAEGIAEAAPTVVPEDGTEAATTHVTGKNGETGRSPATG